MKSEEELEKIFGYTREELDKMVETRESEVIKLSSEDFDRFAAAVERGGMPDKVKQLLEKEPRWVDFANYLDSEEAIAEFINAAIELDDPITLRAAKIEAKKAAERLGLYLHDYKGFIALAAYSVEDGCLVGRVVNVDENAVEISFDGDTPEELQRHFTESVDCYLGACESAGIEPKHSRHFTRRDFSCINTKRPTTP